MYTVKISKPGHIAPVIVLTYEIRPPRLSEIRNTFQRLVVECNLPDGIYDVRVYNKNRNTIEHTEIKI